MSKLDKTLDKIAASSPKTIQEAAKRSLTEGSIPEPQPEMGHRTRNMAKRNERARRLLGLVDV